LIVPSRKTPTPAEMPPLILVKSDGAVNYATTTWRPSWSASANMIPDLILYVVDQRQHLHFEQVFAPPTKGASPACRARTFRPCTVNGKTGKPFKTRRVARDEAFMTHSPWRPKKP